MQISTVKGHSYFTTDAGRQSLWDSRSRYFCLKLNSWGNSPYATSSLTKRFISYGCVWPFGKRTYRTCNMLQKILLFVLQKSLMSVQALWSRLCHLSWNIWPRYITPSLNTKIFYDFVFSHCRETMYPQSCSLATAVLLSPVCIAVTWQLVYMSTIK
jgi:hypothetical protein